jgi:hypothetical protein
MWVLLSYLEVLRPEEEFQFVTESSGVYRELCAVYMKRGRILAIIPVVQNVTNTRPTSISNITIVLVLLKPLVMPSAFVIN